MRSLPLPMGLGSLEQVDMARWREMLERLRRIIGTGELDLASLLPPNPIEDIAVSGPRVRLSGNTLVMKYWAQILAYAWAWGPGPEGPILFGGRPLNISREDALGFWPWVF